MAAVSGEVATAWLVSAASREAAAPVIRRSG